jgi:catechol 2,3-dioxygenase-like lactoylglutathione lyase family enzyme
MMIIGLFHVLATPDVSASRAFYERYFGFGPVFDSGWYVQLQHPAIPALQLGLVAVWHPSLPSPAREPSGATIVTIEVDDADAMHRSLSAASVGLSGPPKDEAWGQRHFFARDPGGHWVDVVQPIAPSEEYAAAYGSVS